MFLCQFLWWKNTVISVNKELGDAAKGVIRSGTIEIVELENEYKSLAERIARFPRVDRGEAEALALSYRINVYGMGYCSMMGLFNWKDNQLDIDRLRRIVKWHRE